MQSEQTSEGVLSGWWVPPGQRFRGRNAWKIVWEILKTWAHSNMERKHHHHHIGWRPLLDKGLLSSPNRSAGLTYDLWNKESWLQTPARSSNFFQINVQNLIGKRALRWKKTSRSNLLTRSNSTQCVKFHPHWVRVGTTTQPLSFWETCAQLGWWWSWQSSWGHPCSEWFHSSNNITFHLFSYRYCFNEYTHT